MNYQKVQPGTNKRGTQPNLVGQTYNRLTVLGPCRLLSEGQAAWGCRCTCGRGRPRKTENKPLTQAVKQFTL